MKRALRNLLTNGDFGEVSETRRKVMRANSSKNTKPELVVRSLLHGMGYRFRLHCKDLPGTPDIVLPKHKKIVEVHGCFWHMHECSRGKRSPRSNASYWKAKLEGNRLRDDENLKALSKLGWNVMIVWECEVRSGEDQILRERLTNFLSPSPIPIS